MGKEIVLRYTLAILLGTVCITVMASSFNTSFDKVASTSLFGCIISVANEDESLGPVIKKGMNRFGGYLCIMLRDALPPLPDALLLILFPCVFVFLVQMFVESAYISTNYINKYKMKHFVIQLQVAFGVVYVGDTVDDDDKEDRNSLMIAVFRTSAILAGVVCLLLASLLVYPETSMQASTTSLSESLRLLGKLSVKITNHRMQGRTMPRYDHRQILFAADPVMDDQVSLLSQVDKKLARVTALLPHLLLEPIWVPGLPLRLLGAQAEFAPLWMPFLTVLVSRLRRIRSSLSAMDSNMRISSDEADKELTELIAKKMTQLIKHVSLSMSLVGEYITSPYNPSQHRSLSGEKHCTALWKGDLSIKEKLVAVHIKVQTSIEQFAVAFEDSIQQNDMMLPHPEPNEHLPQPSVHSTASERASADMFNNKFRVNRYTMSTTASHRSRLGHTLDYYFKTGPRRTFCNLCIQVAIQTTSVIMEVVDFMDSMDHHKDLKRQQQQQQQQGKEASPPKLTRQRSVDETAFIPLRSCSGLRLTEERERVAGTGLGDDDDNDDGDEEEASFLSEDEGNSHVDIMLPLNVVTEAEDNKTDI